MIWCPCVSHSLSGISPVLSVSMGLLFPVCRQEAGALIAPFCHMLLQVHRHLEPRKRRTERKRKQQNLAPISWDHSVTDWTGMFYFFRVLAVAASILLPLHDWLQAGLSEKKEKKKLGISHFPWTLTIPIPSSQVRTREHLLEISLFSLWLLQIFGLCWIQAEGYCRGEKRAKSLSGWEYYEFWSSPSHLLLFTF